MVIATNPFAAGLLTLHKALAEHRDRAGGLYRITNERKYSEAMAKIDAYMANAGLMYPEFFYAGYELKTMDKAAGSNFTAKRKEIDKWN